MIKSMSATLSGSSILVAIPSAFDVKNAISNETSLPSSVKEDLIDNLDRLLDWLDLLTDQERQERTKEFLEGAWAFLWTNCLELWLMIETFINNLPS